MTIHAKIQERAKEMARLLPPHCTAEARVADGDWSELHITYADKEHKRYAVVTQFRDPRDLPSLRPVSLKMVEQMIHAIDEGLPRK